MKEIGLAEGLHKGGDIVDDTMPMVTEPVPHLDGIVRTASEPCACENPWMNHPQGFIFERGDGVRHFPQEAR